MFLVTCEPRCDEAMAFPSRLRPVVSDVITSVTAGELHPPRHAFTVNVEGEALCIPYRVYYDSELLRRELRNSQAASRLMLLCLGTRHHDGYLRQACLRELVESKAAWVMPYVLQLAGEYVVEIAEDVAGFIRGCDPVTLKAFASENPGYLATFAQRMTSYWSCYHRHAYPERHAYPGARILAALDAAVK